jgi:hypothetical protein
MAIHPANAPSRDQFAEAIIHIEAIKRDLANEHAEYMRRCKPLRAAISTVIDDSKGKGIRSKVLRGEIKRRDHLRKADAVGDNFEDADEAQYDWLRKEFGKDAELPLFAAAADASEAAARATEPPRRRRKSADEHAADKSADVDDLVIGSAGL